MKNNSGLTALKVIGILLLMLIATICDMGDNTSNKSEYNKNSDRRSSYWYDDSYTRKRKADATLRKYYDVDENGHITGIKEGTIVNGKPYHK